MNLNLLLMSYIQTYLFTDFTCKIKVLLLFFANVILHLCLLFYYMSVACFYSISSFTYLHTPWNLLYSGKHRTHLKVSFLVQFEMFFCVAIPPDFRCSFAHQTSLFTTDSDCYCYTFVKERNLII